jgi:DNA mismatch repair protein MutS
VDEPPVSAKDGGAIKEGFNAQLDELKDIMKNGEGIIQKTEIQERDRTGIKNLKIGYNRVFGYYIEVTKSNYNLVPSNYVRKQTLTNAERFITEELKTIENTILSATDRSLALEVEIFQQLRNEVYKYLNQCQKTSSAIAMLDMLCSFAEVALKNNYCRPNITNDGTIEIKDGRHPVVELLTDDIFVPNDTSLNTTDCRMAIVTGPNMAGKSTFMRQTALITLMAQIGSFVPCKSANVSIVDRIFTRVGASDDLSAGQSTFMVEMSEVADILKYATKNSLVILDEVGRGTSTFDGISIAQSVLEYITTEIGCKTLFATHYHELIALEDSLEGVKNFSVAVQKQGDTIKFLRKIVRGGADDSYGIEVGKLAGLPQVVIDRAKVILNQMENT